MEMNSPIDLTSDNFDPVQALQSNSVVLPYPKAKTYNNIAEYYSHTFLKNNLGVSKKKLLTPKNRNYSYYLDTIGLSGRRAEDYLHKLERFRKSKKGIKKKPKNVTYTPGSPLRSDKVINLESKYREYWKRKQLLYEKTKSVPDIASILKKSEDIPLFEKIKSLAKPITAQELIVKVKQHSSKTSCVSAVPLTKPADRQKIPCTRKFSPSSSVTNTDYLSDDSSGTEELEHFCRYLSSKIVENPVKKQFSQSKDFLGVTNSSNCVGTSADVNTGLNDTQSYCVNSSEKKQIVSALTPKENILESSEDLQTLNSCFKKRVKGIGRKRLVRKSKRLTPKNVQPSKVTLKKENCELLLKQCTCNPKLSMGSHCTCGVYSTAMNNIRKFKIPRKKKTE